MQCGLKLCYVDARTGALPKEKKMNKKMVVFLLIITSYISVLCAQENILSVFEKSYTEEKLELCLKSGWKN